MKSDIQTTLEISKRNSIQTPSTIQQLFDNHQPNESILKTDDA